MTLNTAGTVSYPWAGGNEVISGIRVYIWYKGMALYHIPISITD